ncbi:hypothetical protein A2697_00850 [Candidatus Curtissbacteria bacterium RIFCSPHIGHO2_01_FULL_41_44]|uniref:Uncharacterized protein n=1 Tax=Candidatus Curtissbacteria bacterium RIFCSPLOWO2_01_FULL_42_50 TaxID=1797730 RepID=A0A1F5H7H7_9BACT|nr:MAG: hypothetical protein A3C33_02605 [Candidatus Curtissbacteria bacterium RIFCSPHIGHO2_02_FULL_42_58]OGD94205.1 MAG: hypothetical protein A2697_00850 [Candidatus Curtissbacteria bacterium RIFCSPHIGHO2_01_FULL_41_44]OGD97886.1 MAG: hypothetical protein A3E71_04935 [Candidatus Curtissbacteria bacterium RIFCSPHIGHO2_12_FULL_42_33]OGE00020.1 MAG: hypothetical protein A3B54_05180 [Candidatus Curtissbacteria bacterium RIFCSPLOWO2_01_FULL_42_50]OGE03317.1 MAG: hypothetical protein A3G16_00685 [Ca
MLPNQTIEVISDVATATIMASLAWLFIDALVLRFEVKIFLKSAGFSLLTLVFTLNLAQVFSASASPQLIFWLESIGLWLIFAAFILDSHSKLQFLAILAIISLFFLKGHILLSVQGALISTTTLALAKITKHNDLILFGLGFVLITIGKFFSYLENTLGVANMALSASILYILAAITLFYWLWQYLVIRFNLAHKLPKLGI